MIYFTNLYPHIFTLIHQYPSPPSPYNVTTCHNRCHHGALRSGPRSSAARPPRLRPPPRALRAPRPRPRWWLPEGPGAPRRVRRSSRGTAWDKGLLGFNQQKRQQKWWFNWQNISNNDDTRSGKPAKIGSNQQWCWYHHVLLDFSIDNDFHGLVYQSVGAGVAVRGFAQPETLLTDQTFVNGKKKPQLRNLSVSWGHEYLDAVKPCR